MRKLVDRPTSNMMATTMTDASSWSDTGFL